MRGFEVERERWEGEVDREAARLMREDAMDPSTAWGLAESIVLRRRRKQVRHES